MLEFHCNNCDRTHIGIFKSIVCRCGTHITTGRKPDISLPGTELKKILSWFPIPSCDRCKSLEHRMNVWGPQGCKDKLPFILKKLQITARRRHLPFNRRLVEILVLRAIRKCDDQMGSSNNHRT